MTTPTASKQQDYWISISAETKALEGAAGLAYSPRLDRFVAYSGGSRLALFDHDVGWTEFEGTGDVPGPRASNGTFGRFRYSPARNVLVVVSSTTQNVFVWKPPSVAP